MSGRGQGRRKINKAMKGSTTKNSASWSSSSGSSSSTSTGAGKTPGKKTTKASTPSITLDEILTVLGLSFDKQLGILNGDLTHSVPPLNILEQLSKLVAKLNDQLEIVGEFDDIIIAETKRLLDVLEKNEGEEEQEQEQADGDEQTPINEQVEAIEKEDISIKDSQRELKKKQDHKSESVDENKEPTDGLAKGESAIADEDEDDLEKDQFMDANDHLGEEFEGQPHQKKRKYSTAQIENDPSIRNPKSEYVTSQTLPAAAHALGLFNEEDGGLQHFGEDFLKKKYAVSSYPQTDLQAKLPGVIPNMDFTKAKPANQVQFTTFQTYIENFYRQFVDDDLKFLKEKNIVPDSLANDSTYDPDITPYLIPHLGPLYSTIWNEEEQANNYTPPPNVITKEAVIPRSSSDDLNDENLETEKVACGPLVSRLLSAIMKDDRSDGLAENSIIQDEEDSNFDSTKSLTSFPEQQGWKVSSTSADYPTLEERLKRELKYLGIFTNLNRSSDTSKRELAEDDEDGDGELEPDWLNPEDDEISTELRRLQSELRGVSKRNSKRKKILLPIVENQLAWQEYLSILDDLEKQIDRAYVKRIRVPKNKKKKSNNITPLAQAQLASQTAHQTAANVTIKALLDKRTKWMNKIGPLFEKEDENDHMKKYPSKSIFDSVDLDIDEDEDEEGGFDDGEDLVLQEQH